MTLLISGASGFVGLNMVEAALARGQEVVALSLDELPARALRSFARLPGRLHAERGDVLDAGMLEALFRKYRPQYLVPAAALQRAPDSRGAVVDLNVTFAGDSGARVRLPRFEPTGRYGEWRTRLLALPSMLRIDLPAASTDRCDAFQAGPTGGLVWRALTFVGTMGLWIPVYFWWFGRRQT